MTFVYSRKFGFSNCEWKNFKGLSILKAETFLRQYCDKIEKESRFRDVTTKRIEIALIVVLIVILLLILAVGNLIVGAVLILTLASVIQFLSFRKGYKLNKLRREFFLKLSGSDFKYFGVTIVNDFGKWHWLVYALVPFLSATIRIDLHIHVRQNLTFRKMRLMMLNRIWHQMRGLEAMMSLLWKERSTTGEARRVEEGNQVCQIKVNSLISQIIKL